jgi:ABC-2 type transport system permease protein/lipopolysaccharide transport system permease protein
MTIRGHSADGVPSMGATPPAPEDLDAPADDDASADASESGLRVLTPVPDEPPPGLRYRRAFKLKRGAVELWRSRMIVWSLTVRDLRATYSQEILGFAWAVLTPLVQIVVFTFLFNRLGGSNKIDTGGVWYPIFIYVGLMPWTFFSGSVSSGGTSLVGNALLNKVYAPREVFPIAEILGTVVSTLMASVALVVLFVIDGRVPSVTSYWAIPLLAILLVFTLGVTLLFAGMTVYLRDMRHALPLFLQVGLFLSPILWPLTQIPKNLRIVYVAINPVGGIVDGLRRCVLHDQAPRASYTIVAAVVSVVWLLGSFMIFKRLETGFADVS